MGLQDVCTFHEQGLVLLMELGHSMVPLSLGRCPQLCSAYLGLFASLVRLHLMAAATPRKVRCPNLTRSA